MGRLGPGQAVHGECRNLRFAKRLVTELHVAPGWSVPSGRTVLRRQCLRGAGGGVAHSPAAAFITRPGRNSAAAAASAGCWSRDQRPAAGVPTSPRRLFALQDLFHPQKVRLRRRFHQQLGRSMATSRSDTFSGSILVACAGSCTWSPPLRRCKARQNGDNEQCDDWEEAAPKNLSDGGFCRKLELCFVALPGPGSRQPRRVVGPHRRSRKP